MPTGYTESGYRLYDDTAMERLQQIKLLTMKKEHLEGLIDFARKIKMTGVKKMDFQVFDTTKMAWQNLMLLFVEFGKMKEKDSGGEFTESIDNSAGCGTAVFVAEAIEIYCESQK